MDQVVTLERQDELERLHAQIAWASGRRVIVVAPRGAHALDELHKQRLLRRWADSEGVQVALVTEDLTLQEIAGEAGLPVFGSLKRAQNSRWKWARGVLTVSNDRVEPLIAPPRQTLGMRLLRMGPQLLLTLILFLAASGALIAGAALMVPSATVQITPSAQPLYSTSGVTLDLTAVSTDVDNATIPARLLTLEISGTGTVATTKTQDAPATRSSGKVVFTSISGVQTAIPRGTIVETSAGVTIRFITTISSTLPVGYGARVEVPIEAVDLGPNGNVKALQINFIEGPVAGAARVINLTPTSGGAVKPVRIVTRDDKAKLKQQLLEQLQKQAAKRLQDENSDFYIVPDSVKLDVTSEVYDKLVDDPADQLALSLQAVARGVGASKKRLSDLSESVLRNELSNGYSILPSSLRYDVDTGSTIEDGNYVIKMRSMAYTMPQLKTSDLVKAIQGRSVTEARAELAKSVKLSEPPTIQVTPAGWPRLPWLGFRIVLSVQSPTRTSASQ